MTTTTSSRPACTGTPTTGTAPPTTGTARTGTTTNGTTTNGTTVSAVPRTRLPRRAAVAALLVVLPLVGLSGCSADPAASAAAPGSAGSTSEPSGTTAAAEADPAAGTTTVQLTDDLAVAVTPPDDSTWETGQGSAAAIQWRPRAATGAADEQPWADVLLYAAVGVVDPATGEDVPLPDEPATWLASHPDLDVVAEREVDVLGERAVQVDVTVAGDTDLLRTGEGPVDSVAGAFERFTLVDVDGTLVVVQASSFAAVDGRLPQAGTDGYDGVLASLRPTG